MNYGSCFIELFLVAYFCSSFKPARVSHKKQFLIFITVALLYGSVLSFVFNKNIIYIVSIFATIAVSLCYKFKLYSSIFISLAFSVISALSELIVMRLVTLGGKNFEEVNANISVYLLGLISSKTIIYIFIIIFRKTKHKSLQSVKGKQFIILLMIPFSTIIMTMVYSYIMLTYPVNTLLEILSVISLIFLLASNIAVLYIVDKQYNIAYINERLKISKILLKNQRQYYENVFKSNQEIRRIRHDLKNIFIAMIGMLHTGNVSSCEEYIQNKLDELETHIDFSNELDNALNSILYTKKKEAEKKDVNLIIKRNIRHPILIDPFDLAILIANVLDNAIEAAYMVCQNRDVMFSILTNQDCLIILSENPTINDSISKDMKTTKDDKTNHGYGLMGIKLITEKYDGNYNLEYENGQVTVTIVLTNEK